MIAGAILTLGWLLMPSWPEPLVAQAFDKYTAHLLRSLNPLSMTTRAMLALALVLAVVLRPKGGCAEVLVLVVLSVVPVWLVLVFLRLFVQATTF